MVLSVSRYIREGCWNVLSNGYAHVASGIHDQDRRRS